MGVDRGRSVYRPRGGAGRGRRGDPPAVPGTGPRVPAGAAPGAVRRRPRGVRAAQGPGRPRPAPAVRAGEARRDRGIDRGSGMSDTPPPVRPPDPAGHAAAALTPEAVERVLADCRAWLGELTGPPHPAAPAPDPPAVDLHTLVAQFTALRH